MKNLFFTLFLYALVVVISSCGGNKTNDDHSGAHTHADGTEHQDGDHETEEHVAPEQESFEVKVDSSETHDHDHDHKGDDDHDHEH